MTRALTPDELVEVVRRAVERRFAGGVVVAGEVTWAVKSRNVWRFALGDVLVAAFGQAAGALDEQVRSAGKLVGRRVRVVGVPELGPRRLGFRATDLDLLGSAAAAPHRPRPLPPRQSVPWPSQLERVALVGPDGEGMDDALGVLRGAGVPVRAFFAPSSDSRATVRQLSAAAAWGDVVLLVRGGGDLEASAYNTDEVVQAVAGCPVPVVTGIGHSGDRVRTDDVAWVATRTPTAAAMFAVRERRTGR